MITINGPHYEAQIAGENARVAEILGKIDEPDRDRFASRAFEAGIELVEFAGKNESVAALGLQLQAATEATSAKLGNVAETVKTAVDEAYLKHVGPNSTLDLKMKGAIDAVIASLDPEKGAAVRKLLDSLKAESTKAAGAMVTEVQKLLNVNDPTSSVGALSRGISEIKTAMAALQEQHAAQVRVDAVKNRTPIKGATLETWVASVLGPIAAARGEAFDSVSTVEGAIKDCKVGDYLCEIDGSATGGRSASVVTEAKNKKKSIGALRGELARARENRGAVIGFGVMANPSLDVVLDIFGKHDVVVNLPTFGRPDFDQLVAEMLLAAGLKLARTLAIATVQEPATETVDIERLKSICAAFSATSRSRTKLKGDVTRARGAVDTISETVESLDSTLTKVTDQFENAIAEELRRVAAKAAGAPMPVTPAGIGELPLDFTVLGSPSPNGDS